MNSITCPSRETLAAWLRGSLEADDYQHVTEHITQCSDCDRAVEALDVDETLDTVQHRLRRLDTSLTDETETLGSDHDTQSFHSNTDRSSSHRESDLGGYRVLERIGAGGMGEVFLAHDTRLDRLVALKSPKFTDAHLRERFVHEARAAGKLGHRHICRVHDVFEHDDVPYMVLEYVQGVSLDEWARADRSREEIANAICLVARAVEFAHKHQVIHRDLKPSNILVDADNQPRLMDFGLAKILQSGGHDLTLSQQILGTPTYMSPEQARGENASVDARTDIYALGTILYRLLAGRPPFVGDNILQRIQSESPLPLRKLDPSLPRDLETLCDKAMAKEPADRYRRAAEFADDLELWLAGEPIRARRVGPWGRLARWTRRRSRAVAVAITIGCVVVALLSWALYQSHTSGMRNRIEQSLLDGAQAWARRDALNDEIAKLHRRDQDAATALTSRLVTTIHQDVESLLRQARLSPEESIEAEEKIDWLEQRDGDPDGRLRDTFRLRRSRWTLVKQLSANQPASASAGNAQTDQLLESPNGFRARQPGSAVNFLQTEETFGDAEVEVSFSMTSKDEQKHSVELRWDELQPLRFVVEDQGGRTRLTIFQGAARLRSAAFPKLNRPSHRKLRVASEGGAYKFEVDGRHRLQFHPLAQPRGQQLIIAGKWPKAETLTSLAIRRADTPPTPSLLQRGDELYLQESWSAAREQYAAFLQQAPAGAPRHEATFKRGMCNWQLEEWSAAVADLEPTAVKDSLFQASALCHAWYAYRQLKDYERATAMYDLLATAVSPEVIAETLSDTQIERLLDSMQELTGVQLLMPSQHLVSELERLVAIQRVVDPQFNSIPFENRFVLLRMYHATGQLSQALQLGREICAGEMPVAQAVTETSWILRELQRPQEALMLIDEKLASPTRHVGHGEIQLERARVLFALGRLAEAEAEVDAYDIEHGDAQRYRMYGSARLMKGVLRRLAGDEPGAQQSWNQGRWSPERGDLPNGMDILKALTIEAVASEGTVESMKAITAGAPGVSGRAHGLRNLMANNQDVILNAVRPAMRSERGNDVLTDLAFHRGSFRPWLAQPGQLVAHQIMLQSCPDEYQEEDYSVMEFAGDRALIDLAEFDPAKTILLGGSVAVAWKGRLPDFALGLASEEIRPALAFVLALRYRVKGWDGHERLWKIAGATSVTHAPPVRDRWEARHKESPPSAVDPPDSP